MPCGPLTIRPDRRPTAITGANFYVCRNCMNSLLVSVRPMPSCQLEMNMRQNYLGLSTRSILDFVTRSASTPARFYTQEDAFLRRPGRPWTKHSMNWNSRILIVPKSICRWADHGDLYQSTNLHRQCKVCALFSQPNLRVTISGSVVDRLVSRAVSQPQDVDECILGTRVLGQAFMNGHVNANLLPIVAVSGHS